jgi:hypothetical protein
MRQRIWKLTLLLLAGVLISCGTKTSVPMPGMYDRYLGIILENGTDALPPGIWEVEAIDGVTVTLVKDGRKVVVDWTKVNSTYIELPPLSGHLI